MKRTLVPLCLAMTGLFPSGFNEATAQAASPRDASLVLINVQASDRQGHFVPGLCSGRFRLFEDGKERQILKCALESSPVSIAIVLDASASMEPFIGPARVAVREFMRTADPADEFSLTLVRDSPKPEVDLSSDPERVRDRLDQTVSGGLTALRDAIYVAAQQLKGARYPRRAMLVISDGGENNSGHRATEVLSLLRAMDIAAYTIGVRNGSSRTMATRLYYLQELAKETGGRYFDAYSARDFPRIMEKLDIRNRYVLAFSPEAPGFDGKDHRIRITVESPGSLPKPNLSWRRAYTAPSSR